MLMVMGVRGGLFGAAWVGLIPRVTTANKADGNWYMLRPNRTCSNQTITMYVCAIETLQSGDNDATKNTSVSTEAEIGAKVYFSQKG